MLQKKISWLLFYGSLCSLLCLCAVTDFSAAEKDSGVKHCMLVPLLSAMSLSQSKVKGQGHQGQKRAVHSQHSRGISTEWNALTENIVTQAADATIPSLPRGDFAGTFQMDNGN